MALHNITTVDLPPSVPFFKSEYEKKFVLVMDTDILSMISNVSSKALKTIINNNLTVLWTSKISYSILENKPSPISVEYRKYGLKFAGEISGLLGTFKNFRHFRQFFRHTPELMGLPTIFLDSDSYSVRNGGWDFALLIKDYIAPSTDIIGNQESLDLSSIFFDICTFIEQWNFKFERQL